MINNMFKNIRKNLDQTDTSPGNLNPWLLIVFSNPYSCGFYFL